MPIRSLQELCAIGILKAATPFWSAVIPERLKEYIAWVATKDDEEYTFYHIEKDPISVTYRCRKKGCDTYHVLDSKYCPLHVCHACGGLAEIVRWCRKCFDGHPVECYELLLNEMDILISERGTKYHAIDLLASEIARVKWILSDRLIM